MTEPTPPQNITLPTSDLGKMLASSLVAGVTALIVFAMGYGSLSQQVNANTKALEQTVSRREVETTSNYQRQSYDGIIQRLQQIDAKLDRMNEKGNR